MTPRKPKPDVPVVDKALYPKVLFYKHWSEAPLSHWPWPHFSPQEVACRGTGELLINIDAMDRLEALREDIGKPLILNSAYRSERHNKKVGGEPNSFHLKAMAFDISILNHVPAELIAKAKKHGFKGFGHYPKKNFLHIDTGPAREWNQGGKFPTLAQSKATPTPSFEAPQEVSPLTKILQKPEVLVPVATAIGATGIGEVAQSGSPVAWALAAILIFAALAGGVWLYKSRNPRLND